MLLVVGVLIASWQLAEASGQKEQPKLTPAAKAGIEKAFPKAKVTKVEIEEMDVVVFEAELSFGGKEIEINVAATGEILTVEKEINPSELPAAVRAVVAKEAKGATIKKAEHKEVRAIYTVQKLKTPKTVYEAEFVLDGKVIELEMDANGKILKREVEAIDDEEEEEIALDKVPAAARATILKHAGKNKIREVEVETKKGKTIYEAEWKEDGMEVEVKVSPSGKLLHKEIGEEDDDEDDDE